MSSARPTVCVIGGGLSGLVVAHTLLSSGRGVDVVVVEASARLGGALRTEPLDGVPVECGADSFLTRTPDAVDLCTAVGLEDDLITPDVFGASIMSSGRLFELPHDFVFGMPSSVAAARRAPHLSGWGGIRAAVEPLLPGRPVAADMPVGELVRRRFGRAVLERSVDPLLAGTRAGRAMEMSLEAALPQVWSVVRGRRSVMRALGRARSQNLIPPGAPPFKSVSGGLERLVEALRAGSEGAVVHADTRVESVRANDGRFVVATSGDTVTYDAVVAATPSFEAARFLRSINPTAASALEGIEFASVATVALVYEDEPRAGSLPGSGMLVPSSEGTTISACTWYSIKWPHATPEGGGLLLRAAVGRAGHEPWLDRPDDELVTRVSGEVERILSLEGPPRATRVTRWPRSLPQYKVGHVGLVDRIEDALAATPGVWVTGASYRGSGIPDCIRHARAAARRVLEWLEP